MEELINLLSSFPRKRTIRIDKMYMLSYGCLIKQTKIEHFSTFEMYVKLIENITYKCSKLGLNLGLLDFVSSKFSKTA